jgi:hypothetical protein
MRMLKSLMSLAWYGLGFFRCRAIIFWRKLFQINIQFRRKWEKSNPLFAVFIYFEDTRISIQVNQQRTRIIRCFRASLVVAFDPVLFHVLCVGVILAENVVRV